MIKKHRIGAIAGAIVLAMLTAVPFALSQSTEGGRRDKAAAQGRHFRGHRGFRGAGGWEFSKLNLTDDQKARIKEIRKSHFDGTATIRGQIRDAMKGLHESMKAGSFDEGLVSQKLAEIAPLRAKLMADSLKMREEMNSVLTAEQKTQLEQLRQQAHQRRAQFGSRRGESKSKE
jgi:Spy/CpxP family protein refolding chaperone